VGTTSAAQTVTASNIGSAPLSISTVAVGGANAGDFLKGADACTGATLAVGATCTIGISFKPTAGGPRSAAVSITDTAPGSPHAAALTGTGTRPAVTIAPANRVLAFGNQTIMTFSAPKTVTVTNSGNAVLVISAVTKTGTYPGDFVIQSSTCTAGAN